MNLDANESAAFFDALGASEEPFGMFYSDSEPQAGVTCKPGTLPSIEQEARNEVDFRSLFKDFSCVLGKIWIARKRKSAAYFDRDHFGCLGGAFFLGYFKPQLNFIVHYVSTGIPNVVEGERYLDSPEVTRRFYEEIDPRPAPRRYCIFKPLSQFAADEAPEVVIFFERAEVISGLHQLACFVTSDFNAVKSPFGSGCANIATWPLKYSAEGRLKAVLGGWDPSARKYHAPDEITFAVPLAMYARMLERWRGSFLTADAWSKVKQRIDRHKTRRECD
jgi:uncharacterized protein (DUF169 family)